MNAGRLQARLAPELAFDWPAFVRGCAVGGRRSIADLFSSPPAASKPDSLAASFRQGAQRSC